ncbi:MAG: hypothetical protein ACFCGT_20220 [Sandaracinaceae bacterium]
MSFRSDLDAHRARVEALEGEGVELRRALGRAQSRADRAEVLAERLQAAERRLGQLGFAPARRQVGGLHVLAMLVLVAVTVSAFSTLGARRDAEFEAHAWRLRAAATEAQLEEIRERLPALVSDAGGQGLPSGHALTGTVRWARGPAPAAVGDRCDARVWSLGEADQLGIRCGGWPFGQVVFDAEELTCQADASGGLERCFGPSVILDHRDGSFRLYGWDPDPWSLEVEVD